MTRYRRLRVAVCVQNVTARRCSYPATVEDASGGPGRPSRIPRTPGPATGGVTRRPGEVTTSDVAAGRPPGRGRRGGAGRAGGRGRGGRTGGGGGGRQRRAGGGGAGGAGGGPRPGRAAGQPGQR